MSKKRVTWTEAFEEEIEVVKKRRQGSVEIQKNLVGLAISGGGIRSATFALGVLEGLKQSGLLPKVDFLSTVSGGGYIGAWLSANCKRAADRKEPDWLGKAANWKDSISHLRRYSNYLSPTLGFFSADTWSVGAIWLRNTILVQLTVILAIAVALLAPRPLFQAFRYWPEVGHWRWATIFLFILGVVGIAGNHLRLGQNSSVPLLQARRWPVGLIAASVFLAVAAVVGVRFNFEPFSNAQIDLVPAAVIASLLILAGFYLQPVAVRLVKACWRGPDPPEQINYTQAWVQVVVVIPMMATGFLVGAILWGQCRPGSGRLAELDTFSGFFTTAWRFWPFPLAVVFASLWLLSFCSIRNRWDAKCIFAALAAPVPAMLVLHALLSVIMLLLHGWAKSAEGNWMAYVWAPSMVLYAFSLTIVILIGMLGRQSSEGVREWWSRFGAWLGIYGFAWMLLNAAAVYGPLLGAVLLQAGTWKVSIGGWVGTTLAGLFAGNSSATGESSSPSKSTRVASLDLVAKIAPFIFIAGLLIAVSTVLHLIIASNSGAMWNGALQLQRDHWTLMNSADPKIVGLLLVACLAVLLLLAARVDINEFSLNAFYRSRLVRCYLGGTRFRPGERHPQNFTGFDDNDDLPLAALDDSQPAPAGPLHIVNCALNLGGSKDLALHTRHSATFTLTPLRCGSRYLSRDQVGNTNEIGYTRTAIFGGRDGQPSLGQAISVSGAAASPNMGYHTSPVVAFLLTLFNVRLGWWFPNPSTTAIKNPSPWFSLRYLFMELFGGAADKSSYLAISDGGHFENLAAYELVKRKCRVIIVSDAECDPFLRFEGLGSLIRMCAVDFGAKITIDVNSIRPAESPWSSNRYAVGSIDYGDGLIGTLIYLKASMTGQEATDILQYKAVHPTFPHESTGNQFYAEDQFESYRGLGRDIVTRAFASVAIEEDLSTLARKLEQLSSPTLHGSAQFTRHSTRLMDLWSKLSANPDLNFLDRELTGAWPDSPEKGFRSAFYLCAEMIQLMENVYLDLRLEETWDHPDNTGWRATFQHWANSPVIQKTWQITSGTYGLRFQYFCQRRLGLAASPKTPA